MSAAAGDTAEWLLGAAFLGWARAAHGKADLQIKMLRCSQDNWHSAVLLRSSFASWRQCARCSGLLIWRWRAHGLALLRVVVGVWRLSVFETRSVPGSGCSTPPCTRPARFVPITDPAAKATPSRHTQLARRSTSMTTGGARPYLVAAVQDDGRLRTTPIRTTPRPNSQVCTQSSADQSLRDRCRSSGRSANPPAALNRGLSQSTPSLPDTFVRIQDLQTGSGDHTASGETEVIGGQLLSASEGFVSTPQRRRSGGMKPFSSSYG